MRSAVRNAEAHIPTQPSSPFEDARIPFSHEDQEWPRGHLAPSCQGTQARRREGWLPRVTAESFFRVDQRRSGPQPDGARRPMLTVNSAGRAFTKSSRLLRHADFQRVYQTGRRQFTGNMTVFFLRRAASDYASGSSLRVGLTVGKVLGGAVDRNRIKRRMREAVRSSWPVEPAPVDVVFNPRKSVLHLPFTEVAREVARGLQLAVQRAREAQEGQPAKQGKRK